MGRVHAGVLVLLGAAGVVMISLPWIESQRPMELPPLIEADSAGYRELLAVARSVDEACARGDVAALRARLTLAQWASLASWLRSMGKTIDPRVLRQRGHLIGDLAELQYLNGGAAGSTALR